LTVRRFAVPILLLVSVAFASFAAGCSDGDAYARAGVTIEPIESVTPRTGVPIGGKPAAPTVRSTAPDEATPAAPTATPEAAVEEPTEAAAESVTEPIATSTPLPLASDGSIAPEEGRWIDVDVTRFVVRLMDGTTVLREFGPVAVGEQVDTGEYASTQTGLFVVHTKIEELAYDPPYDTYISHWVGFDAEKANGFHSFLKDEHGAVVDASTGRVSNGCIRTGAAEEIFAFAEEGMPVWVHH
jgi:hypothetical protein